MILASKADTQCSIYSNCPEVLSLQQVSKFCGTSHVTFSEWIKTGQTPMGEIIEGEHYFKIGREYRFIKRQVALLFKMISEGEIK